MISTTAYSAKTIKQGIETNELRLGGVRVRPEITINAAFGRKEVHNNTFQK